MKALIASVILVVGLGAQTPNPSEPMVTVPKSWVQPERQTQAPAQISQYVGIGKEIGEAVKNGLENVVEVSNKFANTPVGQFTMFMIAWKILGKELLHLVIGIPVYIVLMSLWVHFARRLFFGRWVKRYVDGKKQHVFDPPYEFATGDARAGTALVLMGSALIINVGWLCIIF